MKKSILPLATVLAGSALALTLTGCATMDKMYQGTTKVTNPDLMTLKTGIKWMNPQPNLRPVSPDKQVVYLRFMNSSGSPLPNLLDAIKAGYEAAEYKVTKNPDEAYYLVKIDVRYFGEGSEKGGLAGIMGGGLLGGIAGAVVGHNAGNGSNTNMGVGAAAGAIVGGYAMNIMANRNKMVEYDLVVDVNIGERIPGKVRTVRKTSEGNQTGDSAAFGAAGGVNTYGTSGTESSESQQVTLDEDFMYFPNRLGAFATRMAMTPEMAIPPLSQSLVTALSSILP